MHLTKIDCEPYIRKNSVEADLPMDTFRDLARRDFFCRKPGCWKQYHFLLHPPDGEETEAPAVERDIVNQQRDLLETRAWSVEQPQHSLSPTLPQLPNPVVAVSRDSTAVETSTSS